MRREIDATREAPSSGWGVPANRTPGLRGVAEGSVVPMKPGNAGGGKGPWFKTTQDVAKDEEIGP
jgi:hypothetical protein